MDEIASILVGYVYRKAAGVYSLYRANQLAETA